MLIVVLCIHLEGGAVLLEVVEAGRATPVFPRPRKNGEQQCGKNADYGDDDEQFNESEACSSTRFVFHG